jgi:hypothetical protein
VGRGGWGREIEFGEKCGRFLFLYNGQRRSGVEIQVQGLFVVVVVVVGQAERRGTLGWGRGGVPESELVVLLVVVVPPLAHARRGEPGDEKDGALDELPFDVFEADEEREAVPPGLWGTYGLALWREGRWQRREGANKFASNLRGGLPVVEGESERDELLESKVLDEDRATEGGWSRGWEEDGFEVDVCARGVVGERDLGGLGRVNLDGECIGCLWEWVRRRRVVPFRLGFGVLACATDGTGAGRLLKDDYTLEVAVCKVDALG